MLKEVKHILTSLIYALPVRLLVRQLRYHTFSLLLWGILLGTLFGGIGKGFGGAYLFLEPEYMGEEGFWSVFLVGGALGAFLFAYMVTFFINESYRFHFIALTRRPFFTLLYNNLLLPGSFLVLYFYQFTAYHAQVQGGWDWGVIEKTLGLALGTSLTFLAFSAFFFAQRGIIEHYGRKLEEGLSQGNGKHKRRVILGRAREAWSARQETSYFLRFPFRLTRVDAVEPATFRDVVRFLNQHHGKLLLWQILTFLLIAALGLLEDKPLFQIPAGATFLLVFSLIIMIMGGLSFWFRRLGVLAMSVLIGGIVLVNQMEWFQERNQAFGMNYSAPAVPYTVPYLDSLCGQDHYLADRAATLAALNRWKHRYQARYGTKPRAVFVMASGGGLRSAFWTFHTLQQLDTLTEGRLTDEIRVMTGASGGMFGQAYFRELYLRKQAGELASLQETHYRENIAQDLLNRIFFKSFTDLLLPKRSVQVGAHTYDRETGFSFDEQVALNLPELQGRRLIDYHAPEAQGLIPPLILTPTVINQGRQLYVTSSPVSFLCRPNHITDRYRSRAGGIEFRRLFAQHAADSLLMTTALRMNASFPVIMPMVELPSEPLMEVMDAGAIDNYGTLTAVKYLFEFRHWFARNTESVIFLQIRDNDRVDPIREAPKHDFISRLLAPLGEGYNSIVEAKDMSGDYLLEFVAHWYQGQVEVIPVEYPRETSKDPASLSWHLTKREKQEILRSMDTPRNQQALAAISSLYGTSWLADRSRPGAAQP